MLQEACGVLKERILKSKEPQSWGPEGLMDIKPNTLLRYSRKLCKWRQHPSTAPKITNISDIFTNLQESDYTAQQIRSICVYAALDMAAACMLLPSKEDMTHGWEILSLEGIFKAYSLWIAARVQIKEYIAGQMPSNLIKALGYHRMAITHLRDTSIQVAGLPKTNAWIQRVSRWIRTVVYPRIRQVANKRTIFDIAMSKMNKKTN